MADLQHMLTRLKLMAFMSPPLAKVMQVDENFQPPPPAINDNSPPDTDSP
jgi:hypothetical protein